jgi:hypothetical protein
VVGHGLGGKAVVDQAHGGRAVLLDQVDLDGRAPGRHPHPAVLPILAADGRVTESINWKAGSDGRVEG